MWFSTASSVLLAVAALTTGASAACGPRDGLCKPPLDVRCQTGNNPDGSPTFGCCDNFQCTP
ncbi:hypothetical protein CDEST_09404 [Colletotrichum destructivum]|uniref:Uncharacterized protein n=1 Tax=Colletotrichum destructivum TaxID=34406 RepID=A0AAX4IN36_9PEZI|nr:hypothetical protein CDEST_09404 [Colletotrichum destructivum]